jgi:hypothetical protein
MLVTSVNKLNSLLLHHFYRQVYIVALIEWRLASPLEKDSTLTHCNSLQDWIEHETNDFHRVFSSFNVYWW